MDRFRRGLDPELYEKLNPIKTNSCQEIVDLAISQEDAMKKVQNAKKRLRSTLTTRLSANSALFRRHRRIFSRTNVLGDGW
jgi:hypothetical protein